jgi:hypothetical protein
MCSNRPGLALKTPPAKWSEARRVWPEPFSAVALSIPETIRTCLVEARKCLHATAYTACVAMSGRGVEEMCRHFGTKRQTLFEGLKELHERGLLMHACMNGAMSCANIATWQRMPPALIST